MVPITLCLSDFAEVDVQQGCWHSERSPTFPSCECPFSFILILCVSMMTLVCDVNCNTIHISLTLQESVMFKLQIYTTASNQLIQLYEKLMEHVCTTFIHINLSSKIDILKYVRKAE